MDIIRPAEGWGPIIEVCERLALFLSPKGPSISQGSRTVDRAGHSYVLLGLFCAPEAICANRLLQQPFVKPSGGPLSGGIQTRAVMHIYAPYTHADFAGELPLHQPAGPMHKTEEREILVVNSVTKQGFLSICTDVALQLYPHWEVRTKQEKLTSYNYMDFLVLEIMCSDFRSEKCFKNVFLFITHITIIPD